MDEYAARAKHEWARSRIDRGDVKIGGMSKILWQRVASEVREYALSFPETIEDHPWGHSAFKVKKKVFTFLALEPTHLGFSMKLPHSNATALDQPFAEPTGYGLGKSGWVTATFREGDAVPVEQIKRWMEESYRAIAPKKVLARLDATDRVAAEAPKPRERSAKGPTSKSRERATTASRRTAAKRPRAKPRGRVRGRST